MIALAYILVSIVTQRLIDAKVDVAKTEIDRARVTVEQQLSATSMSSSTQVRINSARAALTARSNGSSDSQAVYEPILVVDSPGDAIIKAPENAQIPDRLRSFVSQGQVAYQFATPTREG